MQKFSEWVKEHNPGNYVSVDVDGLPTNLVSTLPGIITKQPHITLMYSKESNVPLDHIAYALQRKPLYGHVVSVTGVDVFDSQTEGDQKLGCIVLKVSSQLLNDIHSHLLRLGCKHSYQTYEPHATLIYDCPLEQCNITAEDIRKKIQHEGLTLTCTRTNNERVNENWVKSS